ncbi:MAG: FliM/FliN family flagellar motor switch protein [Planctomycetota bacterium]|jgi:flagellar motor switch protein FliN/FliY
MAETAEAIEENQNQENPDASENNAESKTQAQPVEFSEAVPSEDLGAGGGIEILLNMSILVTVSIGQTEIPVRQLLQLGPGSVLRLDKPIDAPVDLYLRDTKFATGNVVVVEDRFAVRIKQILGLGDSAANPTEP